MKFEELNLNDSTLLDFRIERGGREPDLVIFTLDYIESYRTQKYKRIKLIFERCFKFNASVNLNMSSPDSIAEGVEVLNSQMLRMVHDSFSKIDSIDTSELKHYQITMASSASIFDIVCQSFCMLEADEGRK